MVEDLDALVFDIQDIGSRYYTYIWTMAHAMEAAAEFGKRIVVLDRPNPIGSAVRATWSGTTTVRSSVSTRSPTGTG